MSAYKRVKLFLNSTQIKINIFLEVVKINLVSRKGKRAQEKRVMI